MWYIDIFTFCGFSSYYAMLNSISLELLTWDRWEEDGIMLTLDLWSLRGTREGENSLMHFSGLDLNQEEKMMVFRVCNWTWNRRQQAGGEILRSGPRPEGDWGQIGKEVLGAVLCAAGSGRGRVRIHRTLPSAEVVHRPCSKSLPMWRVAWGNLQQVNMERTSACWQWRTVRQAAAVPPCKHWEETVRIMSLKAADRPALPQVPGGGGKQLRRSSCVCCVPFFLLIYIFFSPSKLPGVNSSWFAASQCSPIWRGCPSNRVD